MIHLLDLPPLPMSISEQIKLDSREYKSSVRPLPEDTFSSQYSYPANFVKRWVLNNYNNSDLKDFTLSFLTPYVRFGIIIMENMGDFPAIFPAHTDYYRNLGLNYLISAGGDSVSTTSYFFPESKKSAECSYWDSSLLTVNRSLVVDEDKWYAFDAQSPHGVENISSCRVVLLVFPYKENITLDHFIKMQIRVKL